MMDDRQKYIVTAGLGLAALTGIGIWIEGKAKRQELDRTCCEVDSLALDEDDDLEEDPSDESYPRTCRLTTRQRSGAWR